MERLAANARDLETDLDWFARLLQTRLSAYFAEPSTSPPLPPDDLPPPDLAGSDSPYAEFIRRHGLRPIERAILLLALSSHLKPQLLDVLWTRNEALQRGFTEFGGLQGKSHGGFLPSGETAVFLLAGDDLAQRLMAGRVLEPDMRLSRLDIVHLGTAAAGEPPLSGALQASRRLLGLVCHGVEQGPAFDQDFPARRIHTEREWSELVLPSATLEQLEEVRSWLQHGNTLLKDWGMASKLRPGYTALFCGPPGTGKTLSACLLGKLCDCEVYRIDLSLVVSKYIGETEKNLARVFDQAEHRGWILFFDEADALFGKRTSVNDAHDRYANQEISYLLQRIEDFDGVVILASNLRHNIDDAFLRRFQSVVHFPMPRASERLQIWRDAFSPKANLEERLELPRLADRHELSGGTIMNVVRYASLKALARDSDMLLAEDVEEGIRRELVKEGRAI